MPHWVALDKLADEPARHGHKALALARAQAKGLPVLPGWVLPHGSLPRDAGGAHRIAAELMAAAPGTNRWILRSSSPLEDLPGHSAAGLLDSPIASGLEEVATTLLALEGRRHDPALARSLGTTPPLPWAVLAQPARDFVAWCTAESVPGGLRLEGRPDVLPPELSELARRAAPRPGWILELGLDEDGPWLLQRRPAPTGTPLSPGGDEPSSRDPLPPPPAAGFGPDLEHSPLPLCPLLATTFAPWLQARGAAATSWIIDGRWHDRSGPAPPPVDAAGAQRALAQWEGRVAPDLRARAGELERALHAGAMDPGRWSRWQEAWLAAQEQYFAQPRGRARRWAMAQRGEGRLPATVAKRRQAALASLAGQLEDPADPGTPAGRRALGRFLAVHGHHATLPWDGRAIAWWEEPHRLRPWLAAARKHGSIASPDRPADLPGRVLAMCEDDDDLLARLYALWRLAARRAARAIRLEPAQDIFELCQDDLGALLADPRPDRLGLALERGRALAARWEAALAPGAAGTLGVAAAAGRASGPPECRRGALDGGPPPAGCVLVVPSLSPPDALALGGVAAVVCEGGDALGHAALLAREAGVPCVVRVAGARAALAGHARVLVDGDRGRVLVDGA